MNEFNRKPAHAVPNWKARASTEKPAGHRGVARWRAQSGGNVAVHGHAACRGNSRNEQARRH